MIDKAVFRAYDIRGNSKKNLTPELAYNVGWHFTKLNINSDNNRIVVGFDGRLSTPKLYNALIQGMTEAGAEVTSIGLVPTPVLYFADKKLHPAGSIMITGSHNEKDDNGFKMLASGNSFYGDMISNLYQIIKADTKNYVANTDNIKIFNVNIRPHYIAAILNNSFFKPELKIVWDPGNGAVGEILKEVIKELPNENIIINEEVDGNFPNHHPDPTIPDNLQQLKEEMLKSEADIGIAFDGDGDRIGVVTKNGHIIFGDQLLCIYSKELLIRKPGSIIIADVKASKTLFDYINSLGGNAIMWKTGHSLIKSKMIETSAQIAGEMSGHIFFADNYYGYDDALYAAIRLVSIINKSDETLDEMIDKLPKAFNTPEIRLDVPEDKKFKIVEQLKKIMLKNNISFNEVDGIRADSEQGWWLVRASNTQAALIVRCESTTSEGLNIIINNLNMLLDNFKLKIGE